MNLRPSLIALLLLGLTLWARAELLPKSEILEPFQKSLALQQTRLEKLDRSAMTPACQNRYRKLWRDGVLKVDWFYGYLDAGDGVVVDRLVRNQTIRYLTQPCTPRFQGACGFLIIAGKTGVDPVVLGKNLNDGRRIEIRLWQSAVNTWDEQNVIGLGGVGVATPEQKLKSQRTAEAFLQSLIETEVVIYDGHARYGSGPGFYPYGLLQKVGRALTKFDWTRVTYQMSSNRRHPEVLMIAACQSQNYYLPTLRKQFPKMAVAATGHDETLGANEQMGFALIDSLIQGRCGESLDQALVSANGPDDGAMKIFGF